MSEPVYYGVVHGNVVVLPAEVQLREGLRVEVRALGPEVPEAGSPSDEEEFKHRLVELGLLQEIKPTPAPVPEGDRTPIRVAGTPISEMIIAERR